MTLAEFLLACIADDEHQLEFVRPFIPEEGNQGEYLDPARALAEREAKRRIVDLHERNFHQCVSDDEDGRSTLWRTPTNPCDTLRALAMPYVGHPDYQAEWRV